MAGKPTRRMVSKFGVPVVPDKIFPVVVAQDRYFGLYNGGFLWFAIAIADRPYGEIDMEPTRIAFCLEEGPNGTDEEAKAFWACAPRWIAAGDSPNAAVEKLCALENA